MSQEEHDNRQDDPSDESSEATAEDAASEPSEGEGVVSDEQAEVSADAEGTKASGDAESSSDVVVTPEAATNATSKPKPGKRRKKKRKKRAHRTTGEAVTVADPLKSESSKPRWLNRSGSAGMAVVAHLVGGFLLVNFAPMCSPPKDTGEKNENITVAMVQEPEPEPPKPEPIPEPEPPKPDEPEVDTPPEPEPEPEPPKPKPKPKIKPKIKPKPEPVAKKPPPKEEPPPKPASMKPINLDGLSMESTAKGGDFAVKVGENLNTGKMNNKYIDPKRFGKIKTGNGNGDGTGTGTGNGTSTTVSAAPKRNCPAKDAKVVKKYTAPESEYPAEAKRRGIEARIVALLTINEKGRVSNVKLIKKGGNGFDRVAIKYFKKWRFKAARKNCQAVTSTVRYNYEFELSDY